MSPAPHTRPMPRMPVTHQPLSVSRAHQLRQGAYITVLECETGLTYQGKVLQAWKGAHVDVEFGNKHVATFLPETDGMEPNCDCVVSPEDGFMLVERKAEHEATPDDLVIPALANSLPFTRLAERVLRCESALSKANHALQVEVCKRETLMAEVAVLREEVEAMRSMMKPQRVA